MPEKSIQCIDTASDPESEIQVIKVKLDSSYEMMFPPVAVKKNNYLITRMSCFMNKKSESASSVKITGNE